MPDAETLEGFGIGHFTLENRVDLRGFEPLTF
jgi:hypothetical protein